MYSILTATYNRADDLINLYNSLVKNKNNKFTWLIMDDGSSDSTKKIIDQFILEKQIDIKYYYQENQGKIVAINNLMKYVNTKYLIECDSDDYITDNFFDVINKDIKKLDKESIYALAYPRMSEDGVVLTNINIKSHTKIFYLYNKFNFIGELAIVFKTNVRKKYLHEIENKEKFTTEARLYNKLDKIYDGIYYINIPIMVCEYKKDGYTKNINKLFMNSPYGHYKYFIEMFNFNLFNVKFSKRLYIIKHSILFSIITKKKLSHLVKDVKGVFNKFLILLLYIPGFYKSKKFIKQNKGK